MPRKLSALVAIAVLAALLLPATQVIAAPATVTGTITIREKVTLSPNAVAFISIVGQQADPSAGGIVGFQRIDGATAPVQFSVPYDTTQIDPKQSYALFASIVDGSTAYQSFEPVPVITGGPTSGVDVVVTNAPPSVPGAVTGTITSSAKLSLSSSAVAVAALVNSTTGTMVSRQVIPTPGNLPIAFSIAVDPGVIDPADTYVAKAAIVDGNNAWAGLDGVPAVENGTLLTDITVAVTPTALPSLPPAVTPHAGGDPGAHAASDCRSNPCSDATADGRPNPCSDARADPGADAGADPHASAYAHAGTDAYACTNAEPNAHASPHPIADPGSDAFADASPHAEPDARPDAAPDPGPYGEPDAGADAHTDRVAHADPHANPVADARAHRVADRGADARPRHRDHQGNADLPADPRPYAGRPSRRPARGRHRRSSRGHDRRVDRDQEPGTAARGVRARLSVLPDQVR